MTREIPLTRGLVALVDDEDYETVMVAGTWHARLGRYPYYAERSFRHGGTRRTVGMHRFLTGWPMTDHRNGDGLDNRRANLRSASHSDNGANRRRGANSTTGYKGVTIERDGVWRARIVVGRNQVSLGCFRSIEGAARAYDDAARAAFGEFARLNFPDDDREAAAS